jgi:hypothetical protein
MAEYFIKSAKDMEKNWCVECWGGLGETQLFYTKREAITYFKKIRNSLDSSKYIFSLDSIVGIDNPDESVYLTNLKEDL